MNGSRGGCARAPLARKSVSVDYMASRQRAQQITARFSGCRIPSYVSSPFPRTRMRCASTYRPRWFCWRARAGRRSSRVCARIVVFLCSMRSQDGRLLPHPTDFRLRSRLLVTGAQRSDGALRDPSLWPAALVARTFLLAQQLGISDTNQPNAPTHHRRRRHHHDSSTICILHVPVRDLYH